MELEFDRARWAQDSEGFWVSLRTAAVISVKQFAAQVEGKTYLAKLTPKKNRRSLDANAYFWVLCDKLAKATGIPKLDVYREAVRNIGGNTETVCIPTKSVDKFCKGWAHNGLGWITDTVPSKLESCTNVILYYGSSTYDTAQMSRLIDNIVQDCKAVEIETATPDEIARMKARWDDAQADKSA